MFKHCSTHALNFYSATCPLCDRDATGKYAADAAMRRLAEVQDGMISECVCLRCDGEIPGVPGEFAYHTECAAAVAADHPWPELPPAERDTRPLGERLRERRLERGFARPIDLAAAICPAPQDDECRIAWTKLVDDCERGYSVPLGAFDVDTLAHALGMTAAATDEWHAAAGTTPADVRLALLQHPGLCAVVRRLAKERGT